MSEGISYQYHNVNTFDWETPKSKLLAPIAYQGGKNRIAEKILNRINPSDDSTFYDLCCGSGSISIELVNRGFPVKNIYMLDKGPWGLFWRMIGNGTFDLNKFREIIDRIPKNLHEIKQYAELLSKQPADQDTVYIFLILQSCSFGGKAIWIENNKWKNCSFRNYWIPTETSNRRSPVNPMMPMPETLFKRVSEISHTMKGVNGYNMDIDDFIPNDGVVYGSIVYIDPPYSNTTCYGHDFDVMEYVKKIKAKCFVSEGKLLSDKGYMITCGRKKGGISGNRKIQAYEEWLSEFN